MAVFSVKMIKHMGISASTGGVRRFGRFPFSRLPARGRYRFGGDSRHDGL
jgi:hypothetical protein